MKNASAKLAAALRTAATTARGSMAAGASGDWMSKLLWMGGSREDAGKLVAEYEKMAPSDLALMMSAWPELSERERELQAPLLAHFPNELLEWMTAGCQKWGMGSEALARRAHERDLSWTGFRENGRETFKSNKDTRCDWSALNSSRLSSQLWARVFFRWLNPFALCLGKANIRNDLIPVLCWIMGAMFSTTLGLIAAILVCDERPSLAQWGASSAIIWLAWRAWWIRSKLASYVRESALPWRVSIPRWWRAREEDRLEKKAFRLACPGAFGGDGVSAMLRSAAGGGGEKDLMRADVAEESRKISFERAQDLDAALAGMARFEIDRVSKPHGEALEDQKKRAPRRL